MRIACAGVGLTAPSPLAEGLLDGGGLGLGERERHGLGDRQLGAAPLAGGDGIRIDRTDRVELRRVDAERLGVEHADAMTDGGCHRRQRAGALAVAARGRDGAQSLEPVRDALLVVQPDRDEERPDAVLLGRIDLAAQQQQPGLMVAGDRQREQVAARLGDLGRAVEVGERFVGLRRAATRAARARPR